MVPLKWMLAVLWLPLLSVAGCSDPAPSDPGIPDWDGRFEIDPPAPPVLTPCPTGWVETEPTAEGDVATCDPWPDSSPAILTPCPAGWREVTAADGNEVTCDPWPEAGRQACAIDEAHFPGEPGCTRIGSACSADEWADDLPDDVPILYVRLAGSPDATGTRDSPFSSINRALRDAAPGTIVAVSRGVYAEPVNLPEGVTLWGACVAETTVGSLRPLATTSSVYVASADAVIRNLRIGGERAGVAVVGATASLRLEEVVVAGGRRLGVLATDGAQLELRNVVIRDVHSQIDNAMLGRGLELNSGAQGEAQRVVIDNVRSGGVVLAGSGSALTASDLAVVGTLPQESDDAFGHGLLLQDGATAHVARAVFVDNHSQGLVVAGAGAVLTATDIVVRHTQARELDGAFGNGLTVHLGASAVVTRATFDGNRDAGIFVTDPASTLELADVVVRDTETRAADNWHGLGLLATAGAHVDVQRAAFVGNILAGILAIDTGTRLTARDVVIRDTRDTGVDRIGHGLEAQGGAQIDVSRAALMRNSHAGIILSTPGTRGVLEQIVIRDTLNPADDELTGRAVEVSDGASAVVDALFLDHNSCVGINVNDAAELIATDVVVRDMQQHPEFGWGHGIHVQSAAYFELNRGSVAASYEAGVVAGGEGTEANLTNMAVTDTLREVRPTTEVQAIGYGVVALDGANIAMTHFLVARNSTCGLQLGYGASRTGALSEDGGTMDLQQGVVSHNGLCGVNVQVSGFDLNRIIDAVGYFENNGRNLEGDVMPNPGLDPGVE